MTLASFLAESLERPVDDRILRLAASLAREADACAVLFYGSNLRSGKLDGVLDFYVLTDGSRERGIWPTVRYREEATEGLLLRAKIATLHLATFRHAAEGHGVDTTIWARFVQPAALVWARDAGARASVLASIASAAVTAARFAAMLMPSQAVASSYWAALFQATYRAEVRVDRTSRHDQIVDRDRAYYSALLPLAWEACGLPYQRRGNELAVSLRSADRRRLRRSWLMRRLASKPINIARLIRAARTFDGAARYGAWKIERHTGIRIAVTPWRERHPVLAAPAVLWQVWRVAR